MKTKRIALIHSRPPLNTPQGRESQDLAMALTAYDHHIGLFFMAEGVLQLQPQQPEKVGLKDYVSTFAALPFYDVEDIYVHVPSLSRWGLTTENLVVDAATFITDDVAWQRQLATFDMVFRL